MDARGIRTADEAVHFAQILGMADPLTLALAQVGQFTVIGCAKLRAADGMSASQPWGGQAAVGRSPLRQPIVLSDCSVE